MTAHKRTEITIETDQVLIIRRRRVVRLWCRECGCEVEMVGQEEAAALAGLLGKDLPDCAQPRGWHISQGQAGTGLICLESLLKTK
jgi:hypothetical protein